MPDVFDDTAPPETEKPRQPPFFYRRAGKVFLIGALVAILAGLSVVGYFYIKLSRRMDAKLRVGPFSDTVNIFAAPQAVAVGDRATVESIVRRLRQANYTTARGNAVGWFNIRPDAVEIFPGPASYFRNEPAVIQVQAGRISRILSLGDHSERNEYQLEPQLITNVSDKARERRRLVHYSEIPPALVQAVISAEDKHFFRHSGFDLFRMAKAAWVDLRTGKKEQGASTLSMQLARGLWLDPDKRWRRKFAELLMTLHLEARLTKQQIFEYYANQVYLGRRGTYDINGFGEGARAFFGKDIGRLTVPEAATLAGMVQRPSYLNPYRYPDRVRQRRDIVLSLMRQNGYLTDAQYRAAAASPLAVTAGDDNASEAAQYFVDLVNDDLQERFGDSQERASYVYTTLDWNLQQAADEAVRSGMRQVDEALRKRRHKGSKGQAPGRPQVALVALDPRTGEVKALVGGRDYGASQLNHALAERQPGSVFKPFVYAAALDTGVTGGTEIFTPASTVMDEPTTFIFGKSTYQPNNFGHEFMGEVTFRTALAHSLNVATIKVAEEVGYAKVVSLARSAGLDDNLQPTPALALGAYEATPVEMAGAYTIFANGGVYVRPDLVSLVRSRGGHPIYRHEPDRHPVLDPRVAYLMVNMMQEVLRSGTAAGVRARGFRAPAAGKTGTSRDGWFAGFTSNLLCIVWVGFDDNRDLGLEGAKSALPVWTEFMKRAVQLRPYRDVQPFAAPKGIATAEVCEETGQLATPYCPTTRNEVFLDGTQPVVECERHGNPLNVADRAAELPMLVPLPPVPAITPR